MPAWLQLITHAPTRDSALDKMRAALDAYVVRGVGHNISFLRDLCAHPRFIEGSLSTAFIKEEYPQVRMRHFATVKLYSLMHSLACADMMAATAYHCCALHVASLDHLMCSSIPRPS